MIKDINLTVIDFEFKSILERFRLCKHLVYSPSLNILETKVNAILNEVDNHIENITLNNSKLNIELTNANAIIEKLKTELYNKTRNDIIEPENKVNNTIPNTNQECIELNKANKVIISLREELANMSICFVNKKAELTKANDTIKELNKTMNKLTADYKLIKDKLITGNISLVNELDILNTKLKKQTIDIISN